LENEKNSYGKGKASRNQNAANEDGNSENARNEPKQRETRLNGKTNIKQQEWKKK